MKQRQRDDEWISEADAELARRNPSHIYKCSGCGAWGCGLSGFNDAGTPYCSTECYLSTHPENG